MKPGNRHNCEMVPIHSKRIALTDERTVTYIIHKYVQPFCSSAEGFFIFKSGSGCLAPIGVGGLATKALFAFLARSKRPEELAICSWMLTKAPCAI